MPSKIHCVLTVLQVLRSSQMDGDRVVMVGWKKAFGIARPILTGKRSFCMLTNQTFRLCVLNCRYAMSQYHFNKEGAVVSSASEKG